ncbi:gephyrin-like molybdotransferase receptor GlpR [Streptomyces fragilis]|uniref:Gephyrin-like molybdotransferase receptor GlpR n=1 Tax=Streptomyces fragilis TaxID=67301 RepID=A0ABV2YCK1_9ACTN|nr:gephyrin-like molybdotransferase receptor GlpR [Streptomyces fragilis]
MSSSGLIYAVIVGAWAAYLVPMWLRRQDELNEARPTERFSTAIRLLSGRAGMERRYAKDLARSSDEAEPAADTVDPDAVTDSVDVRAFAVPPDDPRPAGPEQRRGEASGVRRRGEGPPAGRRPGHEAAPGDPGPGAQRPDRPDRAEHLASAEHLARTERLERPDRLDRASRAAAERKAEAARAKIARSKVMARRRRTITLLFVAFSVGAVAAAVGGVAFLWAPALPAVLLSVYIAYLRTQERRRFAYRMDRGQAEEAARRVRERGRERERERGGRRRPRPSPAADPERGTERIPRGPGHVPGVQRPAGRPGDGVPEPEGHDPGPATLSSLAADRLALIEQTDHAEWVDQQREPEREAGPSDSWEPVPVPLPTYVTAPVAPRATSDVDLTDDAWSSARAAVGAQRHDQPAEPQAAAGEAEASDASAAEEPQAHPEPRGRSGGRRGRGRGRTPLFDQYAEGDRDRPRAANE